MAAEIDRTVIKELRSNDILNQIAKIVQEIRFGSVEIIIHEGRVVQLERKEKLRFDAK